MKKIFFIFSNDGLILKSNSSDDYSIPYEENLLDIFIPIDTPMFVTFFEEAEIWTYRTKTNIINFNDYEECSLRNSYYKLEHRLYLLAGKCAELLYWHENTKFCGKCGAQIEFSTNISKRCQKCGNEIWPQLATAVIVLIRKDEKVLLVRSKNFKREYYGLVAGFVETGETLEDAVRREVLEETNLKIKNIQYFGSQPWPYPCGLMIGFTADYESGNLKLQEEEIAAASWFTPTNLPPIPEKLSIARMLIDKWLFKNENDGKEKTES